MLAALLLFATLQPNVEIGQDLTSPAQVAGPWEALVAPGEVAGFSLGGDERTRRRTVSRARYLRSQGSENGANLVE